MRSLWVAFLLTIAAFGQNPDPLFWGGLKPGPYAIGYRSYFEFDSTRSFGASGSVRPVLVNMWYPAEAVGSDRLRYRDYLNIPPLPRYSTFIWSLNDFSLTR